MYSQKIEEEDGESGKQVKRKIFEEKNERKLRLLYCTYLLYHDTITSSVIILSFLTSPSFFFRFFSKRS